MANEREVQYYHYLPSNPDGDEGDDYDDLPINALLEDVDYPNFDIQELEVEVEFVDDDETKTFT